MNRVAWLYKTNKGAQSKVGHELLTDCGKWTVRGWVVASEIGAW